MNVVLDNIIFTLQRNGGISVVWNEHLRRARADLAQSLEELDYVEKLTPRFMERYRIPAYKAQTPAVFQLLKILSAYSKRCLSVAKTVRSQASRIMSAEKP